MLATQVLGLSRPLPIPYKPSLSLALPPRSFPSPKPEGPEPYTQPKLQATTRRRNLLLQGGVAHGDAHRGAVLCTCRRVSYSRLNNESYMINPASPILLVQAPTLYSASYAESTSFGMSCNETIVSVACECFFVLCRSFQGFMAFEALRRGLP